MSIKPGLDWAQILREMNDPKTLEIMKQAYGSTMMNGKIEYPKNFDPNGWNDPIVNEEDRVQAQKEDNLVFGYWYDRK